MNANKNTKKIGALAAVLLAGGAFLAAPAANAATVLAADQAGTVIAQDASGVVVAQDESSMLRATPSAPRAVTVSTKPGATVSLTAKGAKAHSKKADKNGKATFTKLDAGKQYTVSAMGASTMVTPVLKAGKADDLKVMTTNQVGSVDLTWNYRNAKARGDVAFTVTATPVGSTANTTIDRPISIETTSKDSELTGLNPNALYSFSVTPHNALGDGQPSVARMSRSLADLTGISGPTRPAPVAQDADAKNATQVPAVKPGPTPAPQPSTRTIWVCPEGFGDVQGVCTQSQAYTFHTEKETQAYTYTADRRLEPCTGGDCPGSEYKDFGTDWSGTTCPNGGTMHDGKCLGWTTGQKWVTYQVKDAPPMGWYDDGTQYAHDVQVKDATPAGWSDNGSQWIRTTAKIEKVVSA